MMTAERFSRAGLGLGLAALLAGACVTVLGPGSAQAGVGVPLTRSAVARSAPSLLSAAGLADGLSGVSCTSPGFCVSVGSALNAPVPLSAVWDGTSWQREPLPQSVQRLDAVSCASPDFCVAVGAGSRPGRGGQTAKIVAWNGTIWAVQPSPVHLGELYGVSCSSPSACLAVGEFEIPAGYALPRAERWNGQTWSVVANPEQTVNGRFYAVSCSSLSACTATGYYRLGGRFVPLIERWDGSHLVAQKPVQRPDVHGSYIYGVSCPADNGCIAVGVNAQSSPPSIEHWNGTTWKAMKAPAGYAILTSLSCTTITACIAVGNSGLTGPAVAEQLSGTTWTLQKPATPAGSPRSYLDGVSCVAASDCAAVGASENPSKKYRSLGETWNGGQWTIQHTPNLSG